MTKGRTYASQKISVRRRQHPDGQCLGAGADPACGLEHGKEAHYQHGCRCEDCREAHTRYRQLERINQRYRA